MTDRSRVPRLAIIAGRSSDRSGARRIYSGAPHERRHAITPARSPLRVRVLTFILGALAVGLVGFPLTLFLSELLGRLQRAVWP